MLESCLIPFPDENVVRLNVPMTALVLHYDQSDNSECEATGLLRTARELSDLPELAASVGCVPKVRISYTYTYTYTYTQTHTHTYTHVSHSEMRPKGQDFTYIYIHNIYVHLPLDKVGGGGPSWILIIQIHCPWLGRWPLLKTCMCVCLYHVCSVCVCVFSYIHVHTCIWSWRQPWSSRTRLEAGLSLILII
jgi:hypothetical protein